MNSQDRMVLERRSSVSFSSPLWATLRRSVWSHQENCRLFFALTLTRCEQHLTSVWMAVKGKMEIT